jgi:hypothetical protein
MALEGFRPQISKLGPATKMGPASQFLQFFHLESTKIDEKLYNDPFKIFRGISLQRASLIVVNVINNRIFLCICICLTKQFFLCLYVY